jgi:anti-sigma factor RsiW
LTDDIAEWDAAYVLGALSPRDRDAYRAFLAGHPERAEAVRGLAEFVGMLDVLSRDEAVALI